MELTWSTFVLEMINFLVLVWILQHFLYRPILNIIDKRRQDIDGMIAAAEKTQAGATALQQQYEARLTTWDKEKRRAEEALQTDLQQQRQALLEQLNQDLKNERELALAAEQRQLAELEQEYLTRALRQGARFAAKLLQPLASPELENKLLELLLTQLSNLPEEQATALREASDPPPDKNVISSAFALTEAQRQNLARALLTFSPPSVPVEYEINRELLSGLRISMGACVLRMNIKDELEGFAALGRNDSTT